MTTATEMNVRGLRPEECLEHGDRYMETIIRNLKHRVLFTAQGRMRLANVCGWLRGLSDSGSIAQAYEMADNFAQRLNYLIWDRNTEVTFPGDEVFTEASVGNVPANKVVLSDDGSHLSFSFAIYSPLNYEGIEKWEGLRGEACSKGYNWPAARQEACQAMNCLHEVIEGDYGSQITEERYLPARSTRREIPYQYNFNGGLIFHSDRANPTGGEWSIHT